MKYDTLNALYWEADSGGMSNHYLLAMNMRGWMPNPHPYSRARREAREVRGRASKTNLEQPDQPTLDASISYVTKLCTCNGFPHYHKVLKA